MTRDGVAGAILRAGAALYGATWLWAAASKAAGPLESYELVARVVPSPALAKTAVVAWTAAEALLGTAMLLGAARGFVPTAALLAAATALLEAVRAAGGGAVRCGCMALVADLSVTQAIVRNRWMVGGAAALAVLGWVSDRRARRDPGAAAASGPGTPTP